MILLPSIYTTLLQQKTSHVVLADDDAEDREIFLDVMQEVAPHIEVVTAQNGEELMGQLHEENALLPELIFLDLNMPLKNGHECLKEIKSNNYLNKIPIIIYSTSVNNDYIDDTFNKGANFYFPKPSSFENLRQIISRLFQLEKEEFLNTRKEKFVLTPENLS